MRKLSLLATLAAWLCVPLTVALEPRDYAVQVDVEVRASPPGITLSWPGDRSAREYVISRKRRGEQAWQQLAVLPPNATSFTDGNISAGQAYEYEIRKGTTHFPYPSGDPSEWTTAHAYVYAAVNGSFPDYHGKVLLLVDSSVAAPLANELGLFAQDLTGDGWQVIRRDVSRSSSIQAVKDLIRSEYNADPGNLRSVILFGHVPVPYSGAISPDMHAGHLGAWPADLFYADMDGSWTDHSVNVTSGWYAENHNVPGDGKFDQSQIPSPVELEIGRIDFYNMPLFQPRTEVDLLRDYLRKNHEFRHRLFTLPRRGLIRDNFGDLSGDAPAVDAWRHYPVFFGPGQTTEVGPNAFFSTLENEGYLWAYAGGGGDYKSIDTVGNSGDFAARNPRSAFLILHGSYFGDWDNEDNLLRAAIGSRNYTLAAIWSGLPHWFMHHMALGETVGYSTRVTQNNRTLYKSNQNFSAGEVHVSLIGDPTLRMFPVAPPGNLRAGVGEAVNLTWNASPDSSIVGYHVYHSGAAGGRYQRLTASPLNSTSFSHSAGQGVHHYMVRAIKLESTGSGTFYNPSQGAFVMVNKDTGSQPPTVTLTLTDGTAAEAGPGTATFRIERNPVSAASLPVQITIGGTAQNGIDYSSLPSTLEIPAGAASLNVEIVPLADALAEGNETIEISLAGGSLYQIGSPSSASIVITDSQPNERPTISEISDLGIPKNSTSPEIAFTIADKETAAGNLTLSASSADKLVIPDANLVLAGSGGNRTITATPAPDQTGTTKITILVSDGSLEASRVFFITVTNANTAPEVGDLNVATDEDEPVSITLIAEDPEGDPLTYWLLTQPENGELSGTPPSLTYAPDANFHGLDAFTFQVSDGGRTNTASVTITVRAVNDLPVARSGSYELGEDSTLALTLEGEDIESMDLEYIIVSEPEHGILSGTPPNLVYTPGTNYFGPDAFEFIVNDGIDGSLPAVVELEILPENDIPHALAQSLSVLEDTPLAIMLAGTDVESSALSFEVMTAPAAGTLTGAAPNLTYHPATNFHGMDSLTFLVSDGETNSVPAMVEITVLPVDDPPSISAPEEVRIRKNSNAGIAILLDDIDTASTNLTLSAESLSHGIISNSNLLLAGSGTERSLFAMPPKDVVGTALVQLRVRDLVNSVTALLEITITNTPPVAGPDSFERNYGTTTISTDSLLANDSDADGDLLRMHAVSSPTLKGGSVTLVSGSVIYVPPPGLFGTDQFTYTIRDSSGEPAQGTVTLTPPGTPRFTGIEKSPEGVVLSFTGAPGEVYLVVSSTNTYEWEFLAEVVMDGSGRGQLEDLNQDTVLKFYRIQKK